MKLSRLVIVVVLAAAGCSDKSDCTNDSQCGSGHVCVSKRCRQLCLAQIDCPDSEVCLSGLCTPRRGDAVPEISSIKGNAASSASKVQDGLVVEGRLLGDATFELRDELDAAALLAVREQSAERVEVVLPVDVRKGLHTLAATNVSGTTLTSVTLELPDLTGDLLVDRINNEATKTLSAGVMAPEITAAGGNYVPNADFAYGLVLWALDTEAGSTATALTLVDVADGIAGPRAIENTPLAKVWGRGDHWIPVNRNATYRARGSFRNRDGGGTSGTVSLAVVLRDANGAALAGDGAWWLLAGGQISSSTNWMSMERVFGAGTERPFPSEARTMTVGFVLNTEAGGIGDRIMQVQGLGILDASLQSVDTGWLPLQLMSDYEGPRPSPDRTQYEAAPACRRMGNLLCFTGVIQRKDKGAFGFGPAVASVPLACDPVRSRRTLLASGDVNAAVQIVTWVGSDDLATMMVYTAGNTILTLYGTCVFVE